MMSCVKVLTITAVLALALVLANRIDAQDLMIYQA